MEATFISAVAGAIIGAIFGGWFSYIIFSNAAEQNFLNNIKLQEHSRKMAIDGLIQALHDEITTLWERYMWGIGKYVENCRDGEPITHIYPITQNEYFPIYDRNASSIGAIEDNDLRRAIVTTYTKAKSLIDSYRMNNDLIAKWRYLLSLISTSQNIQIKNEADFMLINLIDYAKKIKEIHNDIKTDVFKLIKLFDRKLCKMKTN